MLNFLCFNIFWCFRLLFVLYTHARTLACTRSTADKIELVSIVCNLMFICNCIPFDVRIFFWREEKRQQKSNKWNENEQEIQQHGFGGQMMFIKLERTSPAWRHYSSIFLFLRRSVRLVVSSAVRHIITFIERHTHTYSHVPILIIDEQIDHEIW